MQLMEIAMSAKEKAGLLLKYQWVLFGLLLGSVTMACLAIK